jgi:ATP-dependent helicase HrpB
MLRFPVHPRYARMFLAAEERGCVRPVALMAALTQGRNFLLRGVPKEVERAREDFLGEEHESDFFLLMRAWRYAERSGFSLDACRRLGIHAQSARQVGPLFEQFLEIAKDEGLSVGQEPEISGGRGHAGDTQTTGDTRGDAGPETQRGTAQAAPLAREVVSGRGGENAGGAGSSSPGAEIRKCVLAGFSDQLARRLDSGTLRCELVHGRKGMLARESAIQKSPLLVAAEINEIGGRGGEVTVILGLATAIEEGWLRELFPGDLIESRTVTYDVEAKRVVARREKRFRDLVLEARNSEDVPLNEAAALLTKEVLAGRITIDAWDESVEQWITRVNRLAEWFPELEVNVLTESDRATLIEQICYGETGARAVKQKEVMPVLRDWLTAEQLAVLDDYLPERLTMANGRRSRVSYTKEGPPVLSARIQELYGVEGKFTLGHGRVAVKIEVLAPNQRPIQVTDDLSSFWREIYPRLKPELSRRYPRHEWR